MAGKDTGSNLQKIFMAPYGSLEEMVDGQLGTRGRRDRGFNPGHCILHLFFVGPLGVPAAVIPLPPLISEQAAMEEEAPFASDIRLGLLLINSTGVAISTVEPVPYLRWFKSKEDEAVPVWAVTNANFGQDLGLSPWTGFIVCPGGSLKFALVGEPRVTYTQTYASLGAAATRGNATTVLAPDAGLGVKYGMVELMAGLRNTQRTLQGPLTTRDLLVTPNAQGTSEKALKFDTFPTVVLANIAGSTVARSGSKLRGQGPGLLLTSADATRAVELLPNNPQDGRLYEVAIPHDGLTYFALSGGGPRSSAVTQTPQDSTGVAYAVGSSFLVKLVVDGTGSMTIDLLPNPNAGTASVASLATIGSATSPGSMCVSTSRCPAEYVTMAMVTVLVILAVIAMALHFSKQGRDPL